MIIYLAIFAVTLISYFSTYRNDSQSRMWLIGMITFLALFVGLADMLGGYDRYIYGALFDALAINEKTAYFINPNTIYVLYPTEFGFTSYNVLLSQFTHNRYIFILITTIIIYACLCRSLIKYTQNYPFAVIVFLGLWFFFTFTYLRQALGVSIGWLAIDYAIKRKPWAFFGIVALAFSFHNSAIILVPLYFFPVKKLPASTVVLIMIACALVGISNAAGMIYSGYSEFSGDEMRITAYAEQATEGTVRFDYILEVIVFLWFILSRYKDIEDDDKTNVIMLNTALLFCATLLIFLRSENGGRLSWFYMIGIISTITYLATNRRDFSFFNVMTIALMAGLFVRILLQWGSLTTLYPYKTFLTNGYREGDWVHDIYEYDFNYDQDKFYKW